MLLNDDPERQKWELVTTAMDSLNSRYGKSLVTMGRRQNQLYPYPPRGGFLVSWKHKLQILDFETSDRLEARCCSCGYTWYEDPVVYFHKPE